MPTSNLLIPLDSRHNHLRYRVPMLGAVLLLVSCSGHPRSTGHSPVNMADEEAMPSVDLASIVQNQDKPTRELQALLDAQDPSAWSATRTRKGSGSDEPTILEAPDAEVDAATQAPGKNGKAHAAGKKTAESPNTGVSADTDPDDTIATINKPLSAPIDVADQTRPAIPSPTTDSPSKVRERLVGEIASTLHQENQAGGGTAIEREGLGLLALDVVQPGSVDAELAAFARGLSPAELRSFDSLKSLFRTLSNQAGGAGGSEGSSAAVLDAARLQNTLSTHAAQLAQGQPLLISSVSLCTSVDGYGRYTPFASTTFVQGRAHPAILYLAVDHVTQTEMAAMADTTADHAKSAKANSSKTTLGSIKAAVNSVLDGPAVRENKTPDDGIDWTIDLTQSAMLYHDTDNLPVFNFGEQALRDTSRDKRRDFCVARRIDLPATLSLGRYNLKVTVHDKAGNASAEAIIPIQIVADASLAK